MESTPFTNDSLDFDSQIEFQSDTPTDCDEEVYVMVDPDRPPLSSGDLRKHLNFLANQQKPRKTPEEILAIKQAQEARRAQRKQKKQKNLEAIRLP